MSLCWLPVIVLLSADQAVSVTYCAILFYLNYFFCLSHSVGFTRSSRKRSEFRGGKKVFSEKCVFKIASTTNFLRVLNKKKEILSYIYVSFIFVKLFNKIDLN